MKKLVFMVLAAIVAMPAFTESRTLSPFSGVNVNVPARIKVIYGDDYSVDVQGADAYTEKAVQCIVKDSVLKIRGIEENDGTLVITITTPVEPEIKVGRNFEMRNVYYALDDVSLAD